MTPAQQAAIEAARARKSATSQQSGGMSAAQQAAIEAARARHAAAVAQEAPQAAADAPEDAGGVLRASRTMVNDINAGYQGLNPRAIAKARPIGQVVMGGRFVQIDGNLVPVDKVDSSKFTTSVDPSTGVESLYVRTPEMEDPALASAGRILSYGILGGPGAAVKGAPKPTVAQKAAQAADKLGVTPSLGANGGIASRVAAAGESLITTSGPVSRDMSRYSDEIASAAGGIADKVGKGSSVQDAGGALVRGGEAFASKFTSRADDLYGAVAKHIPKGAKFQADATSSMLTDTLAKFADTPAISKLLGNEKLRPILDDVANGLTFDQAKELRTAIGSGIKDVSGPLSGQSNAVMKQLYAALSDDMAKMAAASGKPAEAAFKRANTFYKAGADRIQNALDILYKGGKDVPPEKAFSDFMALTANKGGRANVGKLARVKSSMPGDEWQEVVGTVIRKMGEAPPGSQNAAGDAFSPAAFLTSWSKMDPTAKRVLFEGGVDKGVRVELDALVTLLERSKDAGRQLNSSRTAQSVTGGGLGAWAFTEPASAATFALMSHLGARALTSRPVLRSLQTMAKTGGTASLARVARGNSEIAGEVANALRLSGGQPAQRNSGPAMPIRSALPQTSQ